MKKLLVVIMLLVAGSVMAQNGEGKGRGQGGQNDRQDPPKPPPTAEQVYKMMDKDGNGCVTLEEFKAVHQKMRQHREQRKEQEQKQNRKGQ